MSLNVGGIHVKVKPKVTAGRVRTAIASYWKARGAKPASVEIDKPLTLEKTRQLAFSVLPATDGYICIADSERYNADFGLAKFLAEELATQVIWYTLYGATDGGVLRILGSGRKPKPPDDTYGDVEDFASRLPHCFTYFDKLGDPDPLGFTNVDPAKYDRGPEPEAEEDEAEAPPAPSLVDDPGTWPVPVARALVEAGDLRVGHLVAFFLPGLFKKHIASAQQVLELWLATVPREALRWSRIGASSGESRAFTPQTIGRCRAQLTEKIAAKHSYFELYGPEPDAPQHYLEINGSANEAGDVKRGTANTIFAYFPWGTPPDQLVRFAMAVAKLVDYATGFVTPALQFDDLDASSRGRAPAGRLAARYPGLELRVDGFKLGKTMHGPHWLTFLGADLKKQLAGGKKGSPKAPGIEVSEAGHGICLRASAAPEVGDLVAGKVPAGLRAIGKLVEPLLPAAPDGARTAGPLSSPQLDDGADDAAETLEDELRPLWHRRFYDDSPRLREIATQLARLDEVEAMDPASDDLIAALGEVPYISKRLGEAIVTLVDGLVARDPARAERLLAHFPATSVLGLLRYEDRIPRLMPANSPALGWLLERATGPQRARIIASVGADAVVANPAVAPAIVAAMPADTDAYSWSILLQPINNHFDRLWRKKELVVGEKLSDAIQPIAKHYPQIYLWTATIYIAQGRVDEAMTQIERMFEAGYRDWQRVRGDNDFAPLFDNPRFLALR